MKNVLQKLMTSCGMDAKKTNFSYEEVEELIHRASSGEDGNMLQYERVCALVDTVDGPLHWVSSDLTYIDTRCKRQGPDFIGSKVGSNVEDEYLLPILESFFESDEQVYSWDCKLLVDGNSRWFSMKALKYNNGMAAVVIGHDIRMRQMATMKLAESEKRFRETMDNAPIVMVQVDEEFKMLNNNHLFDQLMKNFGLPKDTNLTKILCAEDISDLNEWMLESKSDSKIRYSKEINLHTKSIKGDLVKSDQWILLHASIFDKQNSFYIFMIQDITEQKRVSEKMNAVNLNLRYTEKMVALGEMSSGLSHEINNPLAIIDGRASLLLEELEGGEIDKNMLHKSLKSILLTSKRIGKVVQGLKVFAKQYSKQDFERTKVNDILNDLINVCRKKAKDVGVELSFDLAADSLEFDCRPEDIVQALENFVQNAIDAALLSEEKWVRIGVVEEGIDIQFYIEDSGPGVDPKVAPKIFQPFYTTKDIGQGMGLGLSFSKGVIESHDGKIGIDYSKNYTRFIVNLLKYHSKEEGRLDKVS